MRGRRVVVRASRRADPTSVAFSCLSGYCSDMRTKLVERNSSSEAGRYSKRMWCIPLSQYLSAVLFLENELRYDQIVVAID